MTTTIPRSICCNAPINAQFARCEECGLHMDAEQIINQFKITKHDDGEGITVSCNRIGSHIRIEPVALTAVVITTDDLRKEELVEENSEDYYGNE